MSALLWQWRQNRTRKMKMSKRHPFPYDRNYVVDGITPSIKAKITQLISASKEYAFIGAAEVEDREGIEEELHIARYNLERTILTVLKSQKQQDGGWGWRVEAHRQRQKLTDHMTDPKRHEDGSRNVIITRATNDLDTIINGHDPEVDVPISDGVWNRLDKMTVEIEVHAAAKIIAVLASN
jgi:hypothetical protein